LPHLPDGGIFGVVVPQTILHSENARELREFLVRECELKDICLFPDKVFSFSDAESAVLIGRRKRAAASNTVRYRRIREPELPSFRSNPSLLPTRDVLQSRLSRDESFSLRIPELEEIWDALADNSTLANVAAAEKGMDYRALLPPGAVTYSREEFSGGRPGFVRLHPGVLLHELPKSYCMSLAPRVIRRPGSGTTIETSQILVNYARASRGPWRLKALIDRIGRPATSNFITVRPTSPAYPLETLWALLNSPVANAYAFSHLGKRHNIVGDIRRIPMPKTTSFDRVQAAANTYLTAAGLPDANPEDLKTLLLQVDAEVLKLYSIPFELEQSLLEIFRDRERVGVPFRQTEYLPKDLIGHLRFSDFLEFENDWSVTNRERGTLIDKSISGSLTTEEQTRLEALQIYADYHIDQIAPHPAHALEELERQLFSNKPMKDRNV
jgi:hypothetical protein